MIKKTCWAMAFVLLSPLGVAVAGEPTCRVLAERVGQESGDGPIFLRSYDGASGQGSPDDIALSTVAFTYDNALAAIALVACSHVPEARRIGEALRLAALHDRSGEPGRVRNAYRAGPQPSSPPPNGWWDKRANQWLEDDYQVGTSTGSVAWAALALLTLGQATKEASFTDAAAILAGWAVERTSDRRGAGGFTGGVFGSEATPRPLTWKATEHNVDLEAVFRGLEGAGAPGPWRTQAKVARAFLRAQWEPQEKRFLIGTLPDGVTANYGASGLDANLWPQLLPHPDPEWKNAIAFVERKHGVDGGFSFNHDRGGLWTEGTAQAALTYRVLGQSAKADALFATLAALQSPGGYLWATREDKITTGLAIGPESVTADLYYYRLPHLGATAWAALDAIGWNPLRPEGRNTLTIR